MTKKDFLIQLFQKLEPYWSLVGGFLAVLQDTTCSHDDIEKMYLLLDEYIAGLTDVALKEKLTKVSIFLKSLEEQEMISKKKDEEEAEKLLFALDFL